MKKSRLSLAAITALGITTATLSANNLIDIRLQDNGWKFIGVNGGFAQSGGSGSISSDYGQELTETIDDNISTSSTTGGTMSFMVINHQASVSEFSSAKLNYSTTNHPIDGAYMIPEMYVYVPDGNTTPDIRIKYQGDWEGETFYLTLGSDIYSGTYDSGAIYTNGQALTEFSVSSSSNDGNLSIDYIFDRNITDNPSYPGVSGAKNDYKYSTNHSDQNGTDTLRIYTYNSVSQSWETYINSGGTLISSDFDTLEKGKGYWVKYDAYNDHNDAGLILGDTGIVTSDYNASELTAGWNMLSFNDTSLIATGSTGMIVELNGTLLDGTVRFTISDSEGTESFDFNSTYTIAVTDGNKSKIVQQFNKQFAQAQAYGTLSKNFNVRAYSASDENTTVLISDKKFRLTENTRNRSIRRATSLSGQTLYVPSLGTKANSLLVDINITYPVESVYGEYALGLRIPSDLNDLSDNEILQTIGTIDLNGSVIPFRGSVATINNTVGVNATTVLIDTDFNEIMDTVIAIGTQNFYVRDQLFSRTYKVDETVDDTTSILILDRNQTTAAQVTISLSGADNNASAIKEKISTASSAMDFDVNSTSGYLYLDTNLTKYSTFTLEQTSGINRLTLVTDSTEYNASGSVREVYSLENLARATVDYNTSVSIPFKNASAGAAGTDFLEFNLTNPNGAIATIRVTEHSTADAISVYEHNLSSAPFVGLDYNLTSFNPELNVTFDSNDFNATTTTQVATYLTSAINYYFGTIRSDFVISASSLTNTVTLTGDFNLTNEMNESANEDINITISSTLISDSNLTITPMVSDLKYNKVYAGGITSDIDSAVPAIQKISGMKVRKILGTNEEQDSNEISWNFIDLSKDTDEWFNATDQYSLFSFDKTKGYWVYLEAATVTSFNGFNDDGDSSEITLDLTYHHKFTNDTNDTDSKYNYTTTNIVSAGTISVDISGMTDSSAIDRAVATLNGNDISLTASGNNYVGSFSEYELGSLGTSSTSDFNVTFFTADSFSKSAGIQIDNEKPTKPTLTVAGGDLKSVTLTSSADTSYFYVYSGDVNDSSPASGGTLVEANITASGGTATYNLCSGAKTFGSNVGGYRVIAIDSDTASSISYPGNIDYNRVSDMGYLDENNYSAVFYPIYKNASILSVTDTATPDSFPMDYNSSCESSGTASTTDHAVRLTSIADYDVTIAFEANITEFSNTSPSALKTVNISVDSVEIAQLQFDGLHYKNVGQKFLLNYGGNIYSTRWWELNQSATAGKTLDFTDLNKTMLTGQTITK